MALSKEAAQAITADLDKLAQLFETDHAALGVPTNVAKDFAYRCDLLSDFVEKQAAALDRTDSIQKEFDAEVETSHQPDEAYMSDKTTQDELYELGQMVESGNLGKAALENLASKVADLLKAAADEEEKEADEEEDDKEADEEEESDKKAHLLNLANSLLRLAADEDDADESDDSDDDADDSDDSDDKEDDKEDDDADEGADKEASFAHGYSL